MLQYIKNEQHYSFLIEAIRQAKRTVWIGTADIKDLYIKEGKDAVPLLKLLEQKVREGFELKDDGLASSINMATLVYEKWETIKVDNTDALVLQGKSIGNGQTLSFADTLKIDKITKNSLTLTRDSYTRTYSKK